MADGKQDEWAYLYAKDIPFKTEMHHFVWHFPGIICAFLLGLLVNFILEEFLKLFSKKIAQHTLVTVTWVAMVLYLIFFTNFDHWVAQKIHWNKIVPRPLPYRTAPPPAIPAR